MTHKTVAGILPDAWRGLLIKHVCKVVRGSSPRPAGSPLYFDGNFLPWATVADLTNSDDMYLTSTKSMLTEAGSERTRITDPGTLMLTNSGATLGVPKISSIRCGANDGIAMLLDLDGIAIEFAYYYLSSKTQYFRDVIAPGVGQPNLNTELIGDLPIPVPPLPEQKKIAQILSTWDKAITTTEQLLTNSQQQKKALMQQLLTGKKRLLNKNRVRFSGEWKKYTLGELGDTFNGLTGKTKDDFGFGKKYIPYINIFKNSRIDVSMLELVDVKEGESQSLSQYGDIFFTTSSETPEEVGMSSVLLDHVDELYLNSFCFGYRLFGFESLHPEFACYLLRSEHVRGEIAVLGQGATRYNLSKKQLMKLEITLPPVNEQKKIATVLSTADQEISALQQKLDALKQEKKALMQTLLTGKRRVHC